MKVLNLFLDYMAVEDEPDDVDSVETLQYVHFPDPVLPLREGFIKK